MVQKDRNKETQLPFNTLFEAARCVSQLSPFTHNTNACVTFLFLLSHSTLQTLSPFPAAQEIRQLRMKQEGFVREISDLQETVEWKDKKIGVRPLSPQFCFLSFECYINSVFLFA